VWVRQEGIGEMKAGGSSDDPDEAKKGTRGGEAEMVEIRFWGEEGAEGHEARAKPDQRSKPGPDRQEHSQEHWCGIRIESIQVRASCRIRYCLQALVYGT
jgi:hypothetical protein